MRHLSPTPNTHTHAHTIHAPPTHPPPVPTRVLGLHVLLVDHGSIVELGAGGVLPRAVVQDLSGGVGCVGWVGGDVARTDAGALLVSSPPPPAPPTCLTQTPNPHTHRPLASPSARATVALLQSAH